MEPDTFAAVLRSLIKENMTKLVGREAGHSWMLLSCQVPTFFRHTQRIPKMVARKALLLQEQVYWEVWAVAKRSSLVETSFCGPEIEALVGAMPNYGGWSPVTPSSKIWHVVVVIAPESASITAEMPQKPVNIFFRFILLLWPNKSHFHHSSRVFFEQPMLFDFETALHQPERVCTKGSLLVAVPVGRLLGRLCGSRRTEDPGHCPLIFPWKKPW